MSGDKQKIAQNPALKIPKTFKERVLFFGGMGFPIFCASCEYLPQDLPKANRCLQPCGGPMARKNFPKYKGPIPRARFKEICLKCGDTFIVRKVIIGGVHEFSLCMTHKYMLNRLVSRTSAGVAIPENINHLKLIDIKNPKPKPKR